MSSLAKCLGRMSKVIPPDEAGLVTRAMEQYVTEGMGEKSAERAVQDVIDGLMKDLSKILSQVTIPEVKALPLPYGAIIQGFPSEDMRDSNVSPVELEDKVRKNITGKQVVIGSNEGSRSVTSVGMVWQDKDGKVIITGITKPQKILRVAGGNQFHPAPIAVQRMGTDTKDGRKNKRSVAVGGEEPVLLREVAEHGFKPIAIIHFTGEPARIFQEFPNLAAFDKAYAATPSTVGTPRQGDQEALPPNLKQGPRDAANELQKIEAQIDVIGRQIIEAHDNKDFGRVDELDAKVRKLFKIRAKILEKGQGQAGDIPFDSIPDIPDSTDISGVSDIPPFQTQRLRIRRPLAVLEQMAVAQQTWRDWYARFQVDLDRFFGPDARLFQALLAITSQSAEVKANVSLALNAYVQFKNDQPFKGFVPNAVRDLNALREGSEFGGRKVKNYMKATGGDPLAIVVDRHIGQLFFGTDSPTDAQYTKAEQVIRMLSQKLGWQPREVQAALWAANIRRNGNEPSSYDAYLQRLKAEGRLDAKLAQIRQRSAGDQGAGGTGGPAAGRGAANDTRAQFRSVPVVDQSRTAIDAQRTQEFVAVMNRMRAQGMNVDVLTREIFQQGVAQEIQNQIDQLNARLEQATGAGRTAIERQIQLRQDRLLEVMDAQGATFSPYHIALAVDDVSNATLANLITLLHEAAEAQTMGMTPMDKGAVSRAIAASLTEIRAKTQAAADKTGAPVASEQGGLFDILAESLAQQLAAEGIPDSQSLAKAIWRFIKDLYFRAAMAVQRAFGAEPSHKLALDWYENQLRRTIGGDFDWRLGSLTTRFLPEPMEQRASRFPRRSGTPGGVSDYYNGATGKIEQPGVLPDSAEAIEWNVQFQTMPPQTSAGEAIQGPEARARIEAAAQRQYIVELEKVKEAGGAELLWGDWWKAIGSGEDPKVLLAEMESKDSTLATASIGGPRMSQYMNGLASAKVQELLENLEVESTKRKASSNEQLDADADKASLVAKEVNRLESDRRNAELHESTLQEKLKKLVTGFVADQNNGYITAEQYGALSEAVANAERLLEGEAIPEQYQQVFKAIMDGTVRVFDYVKAIAKLDLDLSSMTPKEVGKAIADSDNPTLRKLAENKPLWIAMSVLAVKNAAQFDEVALGYIDSQLEYAAIHKELQAIRTANAEQLREMILTMKEQVKGAGLRERAKRAYITRRRELQVARNRIGLAQARVDVATRSLAALHDAVERAQQAGGKAPSEWFPVSGAQFIEKRPGEAGWSSRTRTLNFRSDGSLVDGDAVRKALALNQAWLKAKAAKAGSREYELVKRQTQELGMLDVQAKYRNAHARKIDTFLGSLAAQAMRLGGGGERAAQMLQRFQAILFQHSQQVRVNANAWSFAWLKLAKLTGINDVGILRDKLYDPLSYFLNTEPGLEQDAALRQAVKMARARLAKPAPEGFDASVKELLTATKTGFEYLVQQATQYGAYVEDKKLKSGLRKAIAQGWLTSMRSIDGGLVSRITSDMEKAGWKLEIKYLRDAQGNITNKRASTSAVTFADLTVADTAETETLDSVLQSLFRPGILRDWLLPFVRKGGNEVFRYGKQDIPQLALQNAWQGADNNVLRWIDNLAETMELPDAEQGEDGTQTNPLADFRLSMLKQLDGLFGMESRLAFEANQTRNLFDPMGPKPHVMMDARLDDRLPHEHLDFAFLDPHTSQMLLAEIAFHASFGRNGERMSQTVSEMQARADRAHVDYAALTGTTHNARVAEALVRGWKDFAELENLASRAKDIKRWQGDLESFMSVGRVGGPFEQVRAGMAAINFMSGQIVDNPKTAFYNMLSPAQLPFATHSLGPKTLRTVADAYLKILKTGIGSLLDAMHIHLMHASEQERWITEAMGASRNQSWRQAVSDIGPGGSQTTTDKWFIKPLTFIRYVQNKGLNLPLQGEAREFPRLTIIPGLGVSNSIAQITAVGGMSAQIGMFQRLIQAGATYLSAHREAAQDPSFRFKAADLGMGRFEKGLFDWWRTKSVEYGLGTLEDVVRGAMPSMAKGERMLTREQVLKLAQMVSTEINGDASVNTTPGMMISQPWLRVAFPLLRWPLWAMDKAHEGLRNVDGTYTPASVAKGLAILAAWNLPIGLAFTFLIDEYDEEILGKKSNLPSVGGLAALPFVGPAAEAIMSDRSIPDTVKAYFVRAARAGNIYGLGADFAAQIAAPTDASSGRRIFSLDQRILVMSQLLNAQQALTSAMHQETATWASVWAPLIRSVGGNGAIHVLDVANNVLELDNAESRNVMRINASNWIRAAASELQIELRAGGSGTPTPMSVWTRQMAAAAMANDRVDFQEAYRRALEAAKKTVANDPTVPASEKAIEAERRVLAGWRSRDPLSILARKPTTMEVRRLLGAMDPQGAEDVKEAINRYNAFTRLIAPSQMETQMRAEMRRLTRPAPLENPYRSRQPAVF